MKRYTAGAFLLMALIGWFVYSFVTQQNMHIDILGVNLPSLPVAAWVVIALFFLYLVTILHMIYYSIVGSFRLRKLNKDYHHFMEAIRAALLGEEHRHHGFKTERYALLGKLIDNSVMIPSKDLTHIGDDGIDGILEIIRKVNSGESVNLNSLRLASTNELEIRNNTNRFENGDLSDETILSHPKRYSDELCKKAYKHYAEVVPFSSIDVYKSYMTMEILEVVLKRINADQKPLDISNDEMISLMKEMDLDKNDYIMISAILSDRIVPEQRMKLFEKLSESNDEAMHGYLYTLFDLEMLEPAKEVLINSQTNEFIKFKAYSALKSCNKNFDIRLFINE